MKRSFIRVIGSAICLVIVLSLSRIVAWWHPIELISHFQVQMLILSGAGLVVALLLRSGRLVTAAAIGCVAAGSAVAPWWIGPTGERAPIRELLRMGTPPQSHHEFGRRAGIRILHANVHASNRRHQKILDLIRAEKPDVVMLQEVSRRWLEPLAELEATYAHSVTVPRPDAYGIGIFSRIPLTDVRNEAAEALSIPLLTATVNIDGESVRLVATHLPRPIHPAGFRNRNAELDRLGQELNRQGNHVIVVGDLNLTMWSPYYSSFTDTAALRNARAGFGVLPTWPTFLPTSLQIPIDHCLISEGLEVLDCRTGPDIGSDHLPLIVDLRIRAVER